MPFRLEGGEIAKHPHSPVGSEAASGLRSSVVRVTSFPALLQLMAFLLGGWFKTDGDDINDLPPDLRDIYVNPWKVKGTSCSPLKRRTASCVLGKSKKSTIETNNPKTEQ